MNAFNGYIFLITALVGSIAADKCPDHPTLTQEVEYSQVKGQWILASSNPEFDEKCKNLTFSEGKGHRFKLIEELFMSKENWNQETNTYDVTFADSSPEILLENESSHVKLKLFLVNGDFTTYIIIYSCDDSAGSVSEAWEIWTRGIQYDSKNLPKPISETLNKLNLNLGDFDFRTTADCKH